MFQTIFQFVYPLFVAVLKGACRKGLEATFFGCSRSNSVSVAVAILDGIFFISSSCFKFAKGTKTIISIGPRHLMATITFGT